METRSPDLERWGGGEYNRVVADQNWTSGNGDGRWPAAYNGGRRWMTTGGGGQRPTVEGSAGSGPETEAEKKNP